MRRCRPPSAYCTMKVREPPALSLRPKPGTSSSKKIASLLPGGSASRSMLSFVSFIARVILFGEDPLTSDYPLLGRPWEDYSCVPLRTADRRYTPVNADFKPFLRLSHHC